MKVIVIGLGSMGRRRTRLIRMKYPNVTVAGVDTREDRRKQSEEMFGIPTYASIDEACEAIGPDAGIVCSAPLSHSKIIGELLALSIHVFTEINLVTDGYEVNMELAAKKNKILFLSSTFLYRNDIQYIKGRVDGRRVNYMYHIGNYLPDWHPWENYKDFFVGDRRTSACREIFGIDMPWIIDVFGEVESFHVVKDKCSSLDLDYDDNYIVTFLHRTGTRGVMCNDVISRASGRQLEVFSEQLHLFWEGSPDTLFDYDIEKKEKIRIQTYGEVDKDTLYNTSIIENAYLDELIEFFDAIEGKVVPRYSFKKDWELLGLIDRIEGIA